MSERSLPFDKLTIVGETNADTNVLVLLDDTNGANLVSAPTANIPSGKKYYNKGCILINTTTGALLVNTGSVTSCSFNAPTGTSGASGASGATGTSGYSGVSGAHG